MSTLTSPSPELAAALEIVDLDRKLSRAMEKRRGIMLTPDHLDLLAAIGVMDLVAKTKAEALTAEAQARRRTPARTTVSPAPISPELADMTAAAEERQALATAESLTKRRRRQPPAR